MSRLLGGLTKHNGKRFYCPFCLHRFSEKRLLDEHLEFCSEHEAQKIKMPEGDEKWLRFENHRFKLRVPFVVYADFESILVKADTCTNDPTISSTEKISHHVPCGFSYVIVGPDGTLFKPPVLYRGENAAEEFISCLLEEEKELESIMQRIEPMELADEDEEKFQNAKVCHICGKPLGQDRVRDHDHMKPGRNFRAAAHNSCNLNYKNANKIVIALHGSKHYDSHLIFQAIGKVKGRRIKCIATNMEQYISFSVGRLQFIDTFQFMSSSLQSLAANLEKNCFQITKLCMPADKLDLLLRKGVYCYEYMDSFSRFEERELPPKSAFFSSLTNEHISEEDYQHAKLVWEAFNIENMGQYHDLYLKTDVLLLADVFENFRKMCLAFYEIDPCHVYTAPGLSWQACLKMTQVELELITDPTMYEFLEKGVRGGVSMISKRFSQANNRYMQTFNPKEESRYIMYLDANNLYGWSMVQPLPVGNFEWRSPSDFNEAMIKSFPDDGKHGYVMQVDLEYPAQLHDLHNDYPLAPERMEITPDITSPYLQKPQKSVKLVPNLFPKKNYILHFRNLKQYVNLGLKITKIHKVLQFEQRAWLKPYIEFNTEQRKKAKNDFEKNFFKLLNNSVFGKTMENLRNRVDVTIVNNEKSAKKLISSPAFHAFKIFDNDLVAVERKKICLTLNRPVYIGFSILDLSKTLMYSFHYDFMKRKYGSKASLLFTDTDSLCYEIKTEDVYKDMLPDQNMYDTSDYPSSHFLHSNANKKVIGKMKDELCGELAIEFIGLRPKMYSLLASSCEKKTAKGVGKAVIKRLRHEDYKRCLLNKQSTRETMFRIGSEKHHLYTLACHKTALTPMDDKRYILEDGVSTLAYGHFSLNK